MTDNNSIHRHRTLGSKINGGEIVEVQGGHIIRSTGRKDRHSKVCTAKGPRDRRVRLAAHTAIQFYDVQDRLGYDRPSKAVDWLIKKAQVAIDELAELPPWHPTVDGENSSILPPCLDSDAIADTIKSFFPTEASSAMEFHHFPSPDLTSRNTNNHHQYHHGQFQDLRLSLQSFQDPMSLNQNPIGFDANAAWLENHHHAAELSRFQGGDTAGYLFNSPQQLLGGGNSQFYSQRGPLQSSNTPYPFTIPDQIHPQAMPINPSSMSGFGFPGFRVPARIQGDDEEQHDGYSDKPSSGSSDSRH